MRMRTTSGEVESIQPAQPPGERTGDGEDHGQQGQDAAGEQENLAEPGVTGRGAVGGEEETGGGPMDGAEAHPVEQMDEDGQRGEGKQPEEVGLEEGHFGLLGRVMGGFHGVVEFFAVVGGPDGDFPAPVLEEGGGGLAGDGGAVTPDAQGHLQGDRPRSGRASSSCVPEIDGGVGEGGGLVIVGLVGHDRRTRVEAGKLAGGIGGVAGERVEEDALELGDEAAVAADADDEVRRAANEELLVNAAPEIGDAGSGEGSGWPGPWRYRCRREEPGRRNRGICCRPLAWASLFRK